MEDKDLKQIQDIVEAEGNPPPKKNILVVDGGFEESSIDELLGKPRVSPLSPEASKRLERATTPRGINVASIAAMAALAHGSSPYALDIESMAPTIKVPGRRNWARLRHTKKKKDPKKSARLKKMARLARRRNRR